MLTDEKITIVSIEEHREIFTGFSGEIRKGAILRKRTISHITRRKTDLVIFINSDTFPVSVGIY